MLIGVGLALIGIAGETYFRLTKPFMEKRYSTAFVPGVGYMFAPHAPVHWTNALDFWTTARANRLGFLDREPVRPERAAAGCHINIIGDSFVAAAQVPIADKIQVRLEHLAAAAVPELDITTAAFGVTGSGQFGQLPLYDNFARPLRPKLVVLVFVPNDLYDNSPLLNMVYKGIAPGRGRYLGASLGPADTLHWHLPDPDYKTYADPGLPPTLVSRALYQVSRTASSWFAYWLATKYDVLHREYLMDRLPERQHRLELYRRHYDDAGLLDHWQPTAAVLSHRPALFDQLAAGNPAPAYQQAVTLTSRALGEFQARTARDGAALVILSEIQMGGQDSAWFALLSRLAAAHNIPVINLHDYILRQGGDLSAASWGPRPPLDTAGPPVGGRGPAGMAETKPGNLPAGRLTDRAISPSPVRPPAPAAIHPPHNPPAATTPPAARPPPPAAG